MAEFTPTAAQKAAIEARGSAVLVSAGAGSGKTKVLTERLMGYLQDPESPADLDSFLIITFTRAAAGELRGRIMEELAHALATDPDNRRLRRQSALCRRAQIGTIHSFCSAVLRENSHKAGLSPDFKIAAEDRTEPMKAAALERVLEQRYAEPDRYPGFLRLADTVGAGRDDQRLQALVRELHNKMQSHARPKRWARQQVELLARPTADAGDTLWGRELLGQSRVTVDYWYGEMVRTLDDCALDAKLEKAYAPSLRETVRDLERLRESLETGWDATRACFPVRFERAGSLRNPEDPELAERVKARREACKKAMAALSLRFQGDSAKLLEELARTRPAMEALLELVLAFDEAFRQDKRRAGLVDYADLEHLTAELLTDEDDQPTELARQLSRRYTEIMVDEYQDVSQVQDLIFRAISRDGTNLFLVGDIKQSIYRFRLADPEIFTEKYDSFADYTEAAPGQPRRILLSENFRSRREVLDAANAVFSLCMSRDLGDTDYDEGAALKFGASYYSGTVPVPELTLLRLPEGGEDEDRPDKTALEAAMVARSIRKLLESGLTVQGKNGPRPLESGDVAILLRTANQTGPIYRRALLAEGLPVTAAQGDAFFKSVEVSTVLSLLAILDDPHQDIPLIAVLRSPAFGFSADALSLIRARNRDADLYTALVESAQEDEACRAFLTQLERLRALAPDLPASELLWLLLEELDLLALCSAMSDGEQRRARLMALIQLAERFESSGYRGLHRFVLWLRSLADKGEAPSLGGDSGSAVQILSTHKSKGLEFPVVFVCDLAHQFNKSDSADTVLVHRQLGLGPKYTDLERRVEYPTLARTAISQRLSREMRSEEMRLLYVAMTRAKERLFLTASVKHPDKLLDMLSANLSSPMPPELLIQANSPLNWLLCAALADGGRHLRLSVAESVDAALPAVQELKPGEADPEALAALRRCLAFRYPYAEAAALPSKVTATGLRAHEEPDEDAVSLTHAPRQRLRLPELSGEERPLRATEKGVATHLVLQCMDFARTQSLEQVQQEIERLHAARFLSDREARAVNPGAIVRLFASPLGERMRRAQEVHREFKFSLLCDAQELYGSAPGEELLLQGVVDCFLVEDGEITVIDYKTDAVFSRAEALERAKGYRAQIEAYARALERICGLPVRQKLLYFLTPGELVEL